MDLSVKQGNREDKEPRTSKTTPRPLPAPARGNCNNCNQPGHFARNLSPEKNKKLASPPAKAGKTDDGQASTIVQEEDNASRSAAAIATRLHGPLLRQKGVAWLQP